MGAQEFTISVQHGVQMPLLSCSQAENDNKPNALRYVVEYIHPTIVYNVMKSANLQPKQGTAEAKGKSALQCLLHLLGA